MKKVNFKIVLFLLVFAMGGLYGEEEFEYTVMDGNAIISKYTKYEDNPIVPKTLDGYEVSGIGYRAFANSSIVTITLPDSLTSIGENAFSDCDSLISIEIPDSLTSIGRWAFDLCIRLTTVKMPDSLTSIGGSAFGSCKSLLAIEIPDSVTSIGDGAFYGCSSLTSMEIPDLVTIIGAGLFEDCYNLGSVKISNSITSIGDYAFRSTSITSMEIPHSVTDIGWYAFRDCSDLTSIRIPDSVTTIENDAFLGCSDLTIIIESKDSYAGSYARQNDIPYVLVELYRTTDNLRIREAEGTAGTALFTLPNNTSVKIIAKGNEETIDGITANWVQVKVEHDTVSIQGETIKAGAIGWCFAGYLAWQQ